MARERGAPGEPESLNLTKPAQEVGEVLFPRVTISGLYFKLALPVKFIS